jgi:hypothetical protein
MQIDLDFFVSRIQEHTTIFYFKFEISIIVFLFVAKSDIYSKPNTSIKLTRAKIIVSSGTDK